jgi:membrane protease YdiL (CAAX protease family)
VVASQFDLLTRAFYPILINYGPAALFLASMFLLHRKLFFPDIKFVGQFNRKQVLAGVIGISLVYLAAYAAWFLGQPREPSMVSLYQFRTGPKIAVLIGTLLVLPPIVEELAFRHFLLSTLPFRSSNAVAVVAVLASAALFAYDHHQYLYRTTDLTIFGVGAILAIARIRSEGFLLPIGLHS